MSNQWMYRVVGAEFGPVPRDELQQLLQEGLVSEDDEVRPVEKSVWRPANTWSELGYEVANRSTATATVERGADEWYCKIFGTELGPLSFDELRRMAENSELSADDEVRLGSSGKWRRVGSIGRLMSVLPFQEVKKEIVPKPAPVVLDRDTSPGRGSTTAAVVISATPPVAPPHFNGTASTAAPPAEKLWYAWIKGTEYGPVPLTQLSAWLKTGQLGLADHVREGTDGEYQVAGDVAGLGLPPGVAAKRPTAAPAPEPVRPRPAPEPEPVRTPSYEPAPVTRDVAAPSSVSAASTGFGSSGFSTPAAPAWGNASSGFGSPAPAFSRPAPAPAKRARSSSGGGGGFSLPSIDLGILKDPRFLGVAAVVALAALWFVLPASQTADIAIYKQQKAWLTEIQAAQKDKKLASLGSKFSSDAEKMAKDLKSRLSSSYPHRKFLMWNAQYRIADIVGSQSQKAEQGVKDFEANLKQAAQYLKIKD